MAVAENESCPHCTSPRVIPVVYGLPGPELREQALRGEVQLGGCIVMDGAPNRACVECHGTWIEKTDPEFVELTRLRRKLLENRERLRRKKNA